MDFLIYCGRVGTLAGVWISVDITEINTATNGTQPYAHPFVSDYLTNKYYTNLALNARSLRLQRFRTSGKPNRSSGFWNIT